MAALADELNRVERQRQLAEIEKNENIIARRLTIPPAEPLTDAERETLAPFLNWTLQKGIRSFPARPETVAAFLSEIMHLGERRVLSVVNAISRMHVAHLSIADPCASRAVRFILDQKVKKV